MTSGHQAFSTTLTDATFCDEREQVKATTIRRARDRAFRRKVLELYDFRCAFTGRRFVSPVSAKIVGLDAAHIVPVDANGSDHPANGLALTKDLHWSFDRGLVGVGQNRRIIVPESVRMLPGNEFLRDLNGTPIREAGAHSLEALEEAFDWHRRNVLLA
jgi:putative restriction endonuclease